VRDLEKARSCVFQANYHLFWATKYWRKVLLGYVEVRLEVVLKTIAYQSGFQLLTVRVHYGDHIHVYVFVSARSKVYFPVLMCVFNFISARVFFVDFSVIMKRFWGGHLWLEGYAVRTAGIVTSATIEEYINRD
jgi:putative transposase